MDMPRDILVGGVCSINFRSLYKTPPPNSTTFPTAGCILHVVPTSRQHDDRSVAHEEAEVFGRWFA